MNRIDLGARVAAASGLTLKEANTALSVALEAMAAALSHGEEVNLHGFGAFRTRERRPRAVLHPRTKERIVVSPGRTVVFSPAGPLRRRVSADDRGGGDPASG